MGAREHLPHRLLVAGLGDERCRERVGERRAARSGRPGDEPRMGQGRRVGCRRLQRRDRFVLPPHLAPGHAAASRGAVTPCAQPNPRVRTSPPGARSGSTRAGCRPRARRRAGTRRARGSARGSAAASARNSARTRRGSPPARPRAGRRACRRRRGGARAAAGSRSSSTVRSGSSPPVAHSDRSRISSRLEHARPPPGRRPTSRGSDPG